jgi:ABC-type Mn2+/Zn2+ transport system permease subunit
LTVFLTELVYRSGVVKEDSALGLIFPFLFAIAVILVSRYVDKSHLDTHAVFVGEIGVAWSNTNSYCFDNCEEVTITPDDERAEVGRECSNCATEGINPRDSKAEFIEVCANCGTYSAAEAWQKRLTDTPPELVFWPKSLTTMGLITLLNMAFVTLLYKELKLTTFDSGLAAALGFRPGLLNYLLMMLVSVTAVGAFDAVGSILVIAFFIIPAATAYILTERLWVMLVLAPIFGALGVYTGYNFSRGDFLGIYQISDLLKFLDRIIGLDGYTTWNTSISASMVIMTFVFFLLAWIVSPRYGLVANVVRRALQRRQFHDQLMLMHIANHQNTPEAPDECAIEHLPEHLHWSEQQVHQVVGRLRLRNLIQLEGSLVKLTERGHQRVENFTLQYIHS